MTFITVSLPLASDGWGGIDDALLAVDGQVPPCQGRGRPPTRKQPGADWQYLQVVKQCENGRIIGVNLRVIFGDEDAIIALLGQSTSYIERSHLTGHLFNSRQGRKTLTFSKSLDMYRTSAALEDFYYNFMRPHKSLRVECRQAKRRRWRLRTPAMAAG